MPFLPPNQQCQSTEGTTCLRNKERLYENLDISKNQGTFLWDFVSNYGLKKFRHGKSIALSTKLAVIVDGQVC